MVKRMMIWRMNNEDTIYGLDWVYGLAFEAQSRAGEWIYMGCIIMAQLFASWVCFLFCQFDYTLEYSRCF